jgi:membrane dipeptidase
MLVIDSHLDLGWNGTGWNRDLTLPVEAIRQAEAGMTEKGRGTNTVSLPAMRAGGVGICLATVLARAKPLGRTSIDFRTQEIAYGAAQGQLAYYRALERKGEMRMLRQWSDVEAHVEAWNSRPDSTPVGFILAMEGADPILSANHVDDWYEDGLRVIGLTHYGPNVYGHGTASSGPLTGRGVDLLRAMEGRFVLDATHLCDGSFWQALDVFRGPVLASHNNCRTLTPGDRQFSDEQIKALIDRGAVIGAALDAWMLVPGWKHGVTGREAARLTTVVDHMDRVCQIAGNARHAAVGSDLDGGFGTEQSPADLDTIADLQKFAGILSDRGYTADDVVAVMHGNWLRFFESALSG